MTNRPPGKGNKKDASESEAKSRVLSARLHPIDEHERAALEAWDYWLSEGYSPRQIMTHAINNMAGNKPEMFRREGRIDSATERLETLVQKLNPEELDMRLSEMLRAFEEKIGTFLKSLRSSDPDGFRRFAESDDIDDDIELDAQFVRNAKKAARKTFRQKQRSNDDED